METTFLPTGVGPDNTLWIIFAVLAALTAIFAFVCAFNRLKGIVLLITPLTTVFVFLTLGFGVNAIGNAQKENLVTLTQNIHTAYDVDDVKIDPNGITTEDGRVMWKATVYEGDTAYEVEVRQDEKTFEPTLISFESDEHIRELKK